MSRRAAERADRSVAAVGPSVHDAYQQELALLQDEPTRPTAEMPVARRPPDLGPPAVVGAEAELEEAHDLLDALSCGRRDEPLADRLRAFLMAAAGDRAARLVDPAVGKALSRYHVSHSGHPPECPCNPCRDARRLR